MQKDELINALRQLTPAERREVFAHFAESTVGRAAPHVFLSYSRDDTNFIRDLMAGLESGGVRVWFDVRELTIGEDYLIATERGLRETDFCVVVVSPYSMKSAEVARELEIARSVGTTILPVMLQDAPLSEPLRNLQWVDFRFQFEAPLAALVAQLQGRADLNLSAQRLDAATKRPAGPGEFVPFFHKNMPAETKWFGGLLLTGALSLAMAGIPFIGTVSLWFVVLFVYAILIGAQAFRAADRKDTIGILRSTLWVFLVAIVGMTIPFSSLLEPRPRYMVWALAGLAFAAVLAAVVIAESSKNFRRRLPARIAQQQFLPTWLKRKKQPAAAN